MYVTLHTKLSIQQYSKNFLNNKYHEIELCKICILRIKQNQIQL